MSFGDSEPAPTYYFSGILFNPSFYTSSSSTYLTQTTAKKYFLSYPYAQGTETITTLKSSLIDPVSTSLDIGSASASSIINIGTNTGRSGNINIGNAAVTGLGNNIGIGSALSNTSIAGKYIELAASTNGISLSTSGNCDIIATAYNIGTSLIANTNINIGTASKTTTIINGSFTCNNGLTMGGSNHITLTTATGTIPTSTQLGYAIVKGPSVATVTNTSTGLVFANVLGNVNGVGTYMATYTVNTTGAWVGATSGYITFSYSQAGTPSVAMLGTPPLLSYSTGLNGASWVVIVQVTANGPGIGLNAITNAVGNSVAVSSSAVFTKIA